MDRVDACPSLIEDLPWDIFNEIFVYLSFRDIVTAFYNQNQRLNLFIQDGSTLHPVKYDETDASSLAQPLFASTTRLVISHARSINFDSLTNLRSLTLDYGTPAQFKSICPTRFPRLQILHIVGMTCVSRHEHSSEIENLLRIVFSNGFPELSKFRAIRLGNFAACASWTGSSSLCYLHLDMQTDQDYQRIQSLCPKLMLFTSAGPSFVSIPKSVKKVHRRLIHDYHRVRQLEDEGKFILDYCSWVPERCGESPPRFDGTRSVHPSESKEDFLILGRILPKTEPYCKASFLIQITISIDFPFKIPSTFFIDSIYHPNIEDDGYSCCCFEHYLPGARWRPPTTLADIINAVTNCIENIGDPENFLRTELGRQYNNDRQAFNEMALNSTLRNGRPRY